MLAKVHYYFLSFFGPFGLHFIILESSMPVLGGSWIVFWSQCFGTIITKRLYKSKHEVMTDRVSHEASVTETQSKAGIFIQI